MISERQWREYKLNYYALITSILNVNMSANDSLMYFGITSNNKYIEKNRKTKI